MKNFLCCLLIFHLLWSSKKKNFAWLLAYVFHGGCPVSGLSMLFAGGVLFVWSSWRRLGWLEAYGFIIYILMSGSWVNQ